MQPITPLTTPYRAGLGPSVTSHLAMCLPMPFEPSIAQTVGHHWPTPGRGIAVGAGSGSR